MGDLENDAVLKAREFITRKSVLGDMSARFVRGMEGRPNNLPKASVPTTRARGQSWISPADSRYSLGAGFKNGIALRRLSQKRMRLSRSGKSDAGLQVLT